MGYRLNKVTGWIVTFCFLNFALVFFRAQKWQDAIDITKGMLGVKGILLPENSDILYYHLAPYGVEFGKYSLAFENKMISITILPISFLLLFSNYNTKYLVNKEQNLVHISYISFLLSFSLIFSHYMSSSEFIYFNF